MNARKIIDGLYTSKNAESILETVLAGNLRIEESRGIWPCIQTMKGGRIEKILGHWEQEPKIDLTALLREFNRLDVQFVVGGGYAAIFHGYPRTTVDVNIVFKQARENTEKIVQALKNTGAPVTVTADDLLGPDVNYKIGRPPDQLNLSAHWKKLDWANTNTKAVEGNIVGVPVKIVDFDSLIDEKTALGRLQDLADVEKLMRNPGEL